MSLNSTAGSSSAEAFASVAEYDAYLLARGITNTSTTGAKENALRVGASYLVNAYRDRWVGVRVTEAQALPWPRADGYRGWTTPLLDSDGFDIAVDAVPLAVRYANIEAARLAVAGVSLEPRLERGGQIKSKSEQVGPISERTEWMDGAPIVDRITVIEGLLRGLVTGSPGATSGNVRLVRA